MRDKLIGQTMDLDKPQSARTPEERRKLAEDLARAERLESRRVWVEDGHVFIQRDSGEIISMTPEVALEVGKKLSRAGSDALINRVMNGAGKISPGDRTCT